MIVLIDNYDSFTFNLFHYLGGLGVDVVVHRNDKVSVADVMALGPDAIVLSPGPCTPNEAGICLDLIAKASQTTPILGVCLGHQAIGQAFGGKVVRATPFHGKVSEISHTGTGVFRGINGPLKATRYHSLVVERASMPRALQLITYAVPARYFLVALRAIVLKGAGLSVYWTDLAALSAFAVVVLALASVRLQRQWV